MHSSTMKNQLMMTATLMNMKACSYLYKQTLERRSCFAMVAKFLDENVAFKLNLHCFRLNRSSWDESERTVSKFRKI